MVAHNLICNEVELLRTPLSKDTEDGSTSHRYGVLTEIRREWKIDDDEINGSNRVASRSGFWLCALKFTHFLYTLFEGALRLCATLTRENLINKWIVVTHVIA